MNTPLLNSLGVFFMSNTTLITYVLFMTAFVVIALVVAFGRNVVSVAFLQISGTLFFLLGFILGLKLTLLTVSFLCFVIAFGDGFARYGKSYRAVAVLLAFAHIVAIYMVLTGKIARFQLMKNISELEVLSLVLFFVAFKTWANGNKVLAAGITVASCAVSVGYLRLALPDSMLIASYFVALGVCALFPQNGIRGFFKTAKAEAESSVQAVKVLNKATSKAPKPVFVGNKASKVAKKPVRKNNVSSQAQVNAAIVAQQEQQRKDDFIQQQILLDQLNEELLMNQDMDSFYNDDISYYQD